MNLPELPLGLFIFNQSLVGGMYRGLWRESHLRARLLFSEDQSGGYQSARLSSAMERGGGVTRRRKIKCKRKKRKIFANETILRDHT